MFLSARRPRWFGLAILVSLSAMPEAARASLITYNQFLFLDPVFRIGSSTGVIISSATVGAYSLAGEFCDNDGCSSGAISTPAASLLRLTNLTLTCNSEVACAPLDISFEAAGAVSPAGPADVDVFLSGFGNTTGYVRVCIADQTDICSSDLSGPKSFSFGFVSSIEGFAHGAVNSTGSFDLLGLFHVDGVAAGASVNLSNSLDIALTVRGARADIPEPATLSFLGAGLLGLALFAKRRP